MASIKTTALLYRPSLSVWTARKKDKAESAKVNKDAGAVAGAANVHKQLLPDSPELEAIQKWASAFRQFVYASTLPWDDAGWRVGNALRHMDFMTELGDKLREGDDLVEKFLVSYEQSVENAKFTLNSLFDAEDYPGVNEVRGKFRFTVDTNTVPDVEDFRIIEGLSPEEVHKLVDDGNRAVNERLASAMDEAFGRLYEVTSRMGSTLKQFDDKVIKKFNDSLIGNIESLVDVMPALNLTGDTRLNDLTSRAKQLTGYDLKELRKNPTVRGAAMEDANELAEEIAQTMRADTADVAVVTKLVPVVKKAAVKVAVTTVGSPVPDVEVVVETVGASDNLLEGWA